MSSARSHPELRLELKPSRALLALLGAMHLAAALVVAFLTAAPGPLRGALGAAIAASLVREWRRFVRPAVLALRIAPDDAITLTLRDGAEWPARLIARYVRQRFVLLRLTTARRWWPYAVWVSADTTDAQTLRALRARLTTCF